MHNITTMRLTILNYHKITGTRSGYAITGVIENQDSYWFHVAEDDYSGPGQVVILYRHPVDFRGENVYRFCRGALLVHTVTSGWLSDMDNAWAAIIKEYERLTK